MGLQPPFPTSTLQLSLPTLTVGTNKLVVPATGPITSTAGVSENAGYSAVGVHAGVAAVSASAQTMQAYENSP